MDDLKLIFAANLITLRTNAGMTQSDLAQKINYSDKSVSKWERGEAIPDAYVLKSLSEIFEVSIDSLLTSHDEWDKGTKDLSRKEQFSQLFIILCVVSGIVTLCFLEFVIVWVVLKSFHWVVLFAAVPMSLIAILVLNSVWYKGKGNMYIVGALVAALILQAFLIVLYFRINVWQILLLIVPGEIIVYFAFHIRRRKDRPAISDDDN